MKTLQPRKPYNIPLCVPDYYPTEFSESWFPITFPGQMEQKDYDVLIVGTGAGGGAVLWRLCGKWGRNGKQIGVVEAGEQLLPTHIFNIPTYNLDFVYNIWRNPKYFKQIRDSYSNNVFLKVPVDYRIVNVLGGRTLHWGTAI